MNESKLKRKVNILTILVILSNLVLGVFIVKAFRQDELTVKRINITDETGKSLRMVISNEKRQHPGIINGEELPQRERPTGIIFFNSVGDECGGLVYDGNEKDAGLVLSVDQFRDDQIMQLQYNEDTKTLDRKYGLQLWDYPKAHSYTERMRRYNALQQLPGDAEKKQAMQQMRLDSLLMEERLFIGKNYNEDVGLFISDKNGRPRIKIYIDEQDVPKMELFDKNGGLIR